MRPLLAVPALLLLSCGSRPPPAESVVSAEVAPEPEPAPPPESRSPATSCTRPPPPVQAAPDDSCDPARPTAACGHWQPPPAPPDAFALIVDATSEEGRTRIVLDAGLDDAVGPGLRGALEVDGVEECFEIVKASRHTSTAYLRASREQVMRTSLRVEIWQP
jgi:hypothetical protein